MSVLCRLSVKFIMLFLLGAGLVVPFAIRPAQAIDLETALWYFERKQWVPAFLDLQILAVEGDPIAATYMGRMFRQGWGVEKNHQEAEKWLGIGADGGVPMAHHRLGWMYARGEVKGGRNQINAVKHWKMAAEGGVSQAQQDLAVMYWNGAGVPKDLILAYTWLSLAARDGGLESAKQNLNTLEKRMSIKDIEQAKSLAKQLGEEIKSES